MSDSISPSPVPPQTRSHQRELPEAEVTIKIDIDYENGISIDNLPDTFSPGDATIVAQEFVNAADVLVVMTNHWA